MDLVDFFHQKGADNNQKTDTQEDKLSVEFSVLALSPLCFYSLISDSLAARCSLFFTSYSVTLCQMDSLNMYFRFVAFRKCIVCFELEYLI